MSGSARMVMYGAGVSGGPWDPDEMQRQAEELRRAMPAAPTFTFTPSGFATKADLDAAVARIETQMLALLAEVRRLAEVKVPARRRRAVRR